MKAFDYNLIDMANISNFELVELFVDMGAYVSSHAIAAAAYNGDLEMVKYLLCRYTGCESNIDYVVRCAYSTGHMNVYRYLMEWRGYD